MIEIKINGEIQKLEESISIKKVLEIFNYGTKAFAVALNTNLVPLEKYEEIKIKNGDKIEVLSPIQGG